MPGKVDRVLGHEMCIWREMCMWQIRVDTKCPYRHEIWLLATKCPHNTKLPQTQFDAYYYSDAVIRYFHGNFHYLCPLTVGQHCFSAISALFQHWFCGNGERSAPLAAHGVVIHGSACSAQDFMLIRWTVLPWEHKCSIHSAQVSRISALLQHTSQLFKWGEHCFSAVSALFQHWFSTVSALFAALFQRCCLNYLN